MPAGLRLETATGAALLRHLPAVARLRITVFREFPYLYDGAATYEERYLRRYAEAPGAAIVLALAAGAAGENVIGAATCLPMAQETATIREPFAARGLDPARFFYFGESVLERAWRGKGLGVAFFAAREAHARSFPGIDYAAFCAVIRPSDHPARPAGHVPLDAFWRRRGYTPYPELRCRMRWREVGAGQETEKELSFWLKSLSGAPLP
ncbi:MAG: GNAT family N-acetyltransferase [Alphaproteobacteria bacterium]|nr:GNAT family N-acetyltransferase [Alphaproteobacteria bacterium]